MKPFLMCLSLAICLAAGVSGVYRMGFKHGMDEVLGYMTFEQKLEVFRAMHAGQDFDLRGRKR